ncbi:MAG: branched-chain amino acid ABC transporter permease [Actinomycetales bacterium]|nr:branched-chain amino acid ABC transporter permease [Actinomycetales bacterium]
MTTTTQPAAATKALPKLPWSRHLLVTAVLAVVLIPLPMLLDPAAEAVAIRVLLFAIMSISWNIMSGFGGLFSFGHAAFFGIGAYSTAWLQVEKGVSPWIGMAVGVVIAALFALVMGVLALRYKLKGAYFALVTLAFAEMLRLWATNSDLVNRAVGYHVPLRPEESWWWMQFAPDSANYFFIALGLMILGLLVSILFLRSRAGQFALAARDDDEASAALGIPVVRYKVLTMMVSAALMATAGTLYLQYYLFIDPDLAFGSAMSIQAILPAVIGGVATIWGPVIGAVVLGPLTDITATLLRNPPPFLDFLAGRGGLDVVVYGILLVIIILVLPKGIYGALRDRWSRR